MDVNTTFISGYDSINVIIDLYNLIHHPEFLEKVIEHFGLNASPNITVTSPNGGELWLVGETQSITWKSKTVDSVKIELSLHSGLLWYTITESTASDGIYEWTVLPPQTSLECRIKITDVQNTNVTDSSDNTFAIDIFPSADDSSNSIAPTDFNLLQNYPNPFNPTTKIKYTILSVGTRDRVSVQLKVYDVLGNEIATLVNEEKPPGTYEVEFSSKGESASGVYFYQLKVYPANGASEGYVDTKKMLLLK
jgi:hypothetical protein